MSPVAIAALAVAESMLMARMSDSFSPNFSRISLALSWMLVPLKMATFLPRRSFTDWMEELVGTKM